MTLCIAAIARKEKRFVTVSDLMLSNQIMSAEPTISKVSFVGENPLWTVMFAGNPTHAQRVRAMVIGALNASGKKSLKAGEIADVYQSAFKVELKNKINDELLGPLGITRDEFVKSGRAQFGDELFGKMLYQINSTELETSFLIGNPTALLSVADPGVVHDNYALGFHAIGSGETLANASLMGAFDAEAPLAEVIYRLLEAKFRGESASGVGRKTFVTLVDESGWDRQGLNDVNVESLRKIWYEKGKPPIPEEFLKALGHPNVKLFPLRWPPDYPT
jgi:hypothetical protein